MAAFVIIPAPLASAYPRPGATERVSVASNGTQANVASSHAVISADGRHQAFTSAASNLVPGDTNGLTERVSVASDGTQANAPSSVQAISADGRFLAFSSDASNLVPGDSNQSMTCLFAIDRPA